MMSNILEKTIGTVFTGSSADQFVGLKTLYQKCLAAKTKSEETIIIKQLLSTVKFRLSNPSTKPLLAGHCLAFSVFAELMGYNVDFAHIHAINLAQQPSIVEKKMGYVACCCLLKEKNELNLLLVNTLVRDLASTNVAIVGLALCALCSAPLPTDAIPSVLPAVLEKLHHSMAYVRCRAVIAVHHLLRRNSDQCKQIVSNVVALLGDDDPHVVQRVLACLPDIIQRNPEAVPGLVQPLVAIQRQVLGGKLPPDMNYKGLQAPWMQISIIRCLPELCLTEEDEFACKEVLLETIKVCSQKNASIAEPPIRGAIISQSISVLLSLEEPNEASKVRAMQYVGQFLQSDNSDIKNEGLQLLEKVLTKYQIALTEEQQSIVKSSLDHSDISIQRRALGLMTAGASEKDIQPVCGQLFTHAVAAKDGNLKQWLLEQALQLIDRYPNSVSDDWKLSALIKLMPLAEDIAFGDDLMKRVRHLLLKGDLKPETRSKMLTVLTMHGESKKAPTSLLKLYIWTLGNFPHLNPDGTEGSLRKMLTLGNKVFKYAKTETSSLELLMLVVCSIRKMTENANFESAEDLELFLTEVSTLSTMHSAEALELLNSLPHLKKIRQYLELATEPETDCSLSCLDEFVMGSIKKGHSKPYQSQLAMQVFQPKIRSPELSHLLPVVLPQSSSPAMQVSQESNKVSEGSWSAKSPTEPTSPEPAPKNLWTREGRVSSPSEDSGPVKSNSLAQALGISQKNVQMSQEISPVHEDPLGELLR